jgi:hypothetical protein
MRYGERFSELGHTGRSNATLLSHGDEDDRASEREPLASAPALGERRHRSLAHRLLAVRFRCPDNEGGRLEIATAWRLGL